MLGGCDDLLAGCLDDVDDCIAQGRAAGGEDVAVDQSAFDQAARDQAAAAGRVDVVRQIVAAGFEVGENGRLIADAIERFDLERDIGLVRDREQMEHAVGRAAGAVAAAMALLKAPA